MDRPEIEKDAPDRWSKLQDENRRLREALGYDPVETDATLFSLSLECARPSWRFRLLFNRFERQLLGYSVNTFMGQRNHNLLMAELDRRYGLNRREAGEAAQAGIPSNQR